MEKLMLWLANKKEYGNMNVQEAQIELPTSYESMRAAMDKIQVDPLTDTAMIADHNFGEYESILGPLVYRDIDPVELNEFIKVLDELAIDLDELQRLTLFEQPYDNLLNAYRDLSLDEYAATLAEKVRFYMPKEIEPIGVKVELMENGENPFVGITIPTDKEGAVAARIHVDTMYTETHHDPISQVRLAKQLVHETFQSRVLEEIHASEFESFSWARERLGTQLLSRTGKESYLEKIPYKPMCEDLVMIYRVNISEELSYIVRQEQLELWQITTQELHESAIENERIKNPVRIDTMSSVLEEMGATPLGIEEDNILQVVTKEDKLYGASAIFHPEVMAQLSRQMGGDYIVLPSSLHEVLVLPTEPDTTKKELENLKEMVQEVNRTVVDPEDFLSDQVYRYDAKEQVLECGATYLERMQEQTIHVDYPKQQL